MVQIIFGVGSSQNSTWTLIEYSEFKSNEWGDLHSKYGMFSILNISCRAIVNLQFICNIYLYILFRWSLQIIFVCWDVFSQYFIIIEYIVDTYHIFSIGSGICIIRSLIILKKHWVLLSKFVKETVLKLIRMIVSHCCRYVFRSRWWRR